MVFRQDGPSATLEKHQIFLLEREIQDYAVHGMTHLDIGRVQVSVGVGSLQECIDMREFGLRDFFVGEYSIKVGDLEAISPLARAWMHYPDRAPVIFLASVRLDKPGKANIPHHAIKIERGKTLDSLDFMLYATHPKLTYNHPIKLEPVYRL